MLGFEMALSMSSGTTCPISDATILHMLGFEMALSMSSGTTCPISDVVLRDGNAKDSGGYRVARLERCKLDVDVAIATFLAVLRILLATTSARTIFLQYTGMEPVETADVHIAETNM